MLCCLALPLAAASKRGTVRVTVWPESNSEQLTPAALSASLDGQPARIVAARGPSDDLMVLLVLDLTEDLGLVELAKESLLGAVDKLPPKAHVGVMRAQDGLSVLLDPTSDREAVKKTIRELPVSGNAALLDTVDTVARIADSILDKTAVRVAVVYVTDSSIYNYRDDYINPVVNSSDQHDLSRRFPEGLVREKISKLDSRLAAFEAPLFIVHLSYRSDRMNQTYQTGLMQLAATAGGASVFCRSRAEVPEAIGGVLAKAASHYSVVVSVPARQSKVVQVHLENRGGTLSYRSRFVVDRE